MRKHITRSGEKNLVVVVNGQGSVDNEDVVAPEEVGVKQLKLDQVVYSVESGTKVFVGWSEDGLMLPLEGRGTLNYYAFDSIPPTTPGQKFQIEVVGEGRYFIVFDLTKQR